MSTQQWQQFLQDLAVKNPISNSAQASPNDTVICDLSHLGLLQVQGVDTLTFLQGQVTNDVKLLDGHRAHYTGYCNQKGRLLALFLAFSHHDHVHLQMPVALVESVAKRLKMYVMRSRVEIADVSDAIIKIGLNGDNAPELLASVFSEVPQLVYDLATLENGALLRLPGKYPRFEIFTDFSNAKIIWNTLSQHAKAVDADYWEWLEIQAGIPEVFIKTQEEFMPQMLNLDLLDAINFKKGCYTGQEIVARTHYLGTVKRRTHLAHINSSTQPHAGDNVVNSQNEIVGKVVRSAPAPDGGYDLLAEIRLESVENGQLFLDGSQLNIQPLPYKI